MDRVKFYEAIKCYMKQKIETSRSLLNWDQFLAFVRYSLRIAPAAARATANKPTMQNVSTLLVNLMAVAVRWYDTAFITQ